MSRYKLPDGTNTDDPRKHNAAWIALGKKVLKFFPGYELDWYNPGLHIKKRLARTVDHVAISVHAANVLIKRGKK